MLMKFSKLLLLSAMGLTMATGAKAEVPDGIWTMPDPSASLTFTTFTDDGTRYYLYNPAAKMFFASGNGWNTNASLRTFGMEMWLAPSNEADAPAGSYELWDNNVNNPARSTGEGNLFTDDGDASWVDHGTQANYSWGYEIVGEYVRFQNVALIADKPEFEGKYLGWDGAYITVGNTATDGSHRDAYTAILRHVDPATPGASVDWKAVTAESYELFVSSDEYQAYATGVNCYLASVGLKEAIEAAENIYVDVTAALAVYTNKESTADQLAKAASDLRELVDAKTKLKAAIEDYESKGFTGTGDARAVLTNPQATKAEVEEALKALQQAFLDWGSNQASVENPVDMTTKIVNFSFDNGDATTGWSGDAFGRGGTTSDGGEHYSKNYNTYQKITGLTAGVYAVGVNAYYRSGNYGGDAENHWLAKDEASRYAKLYATVGERTLETAIANVLDGAQPEGHNVGDVEVTYTDEEGETHVVYAPNTMAAGDYYFHTLGQYANKLLVAVDETGELTLGVRKTQQIGGDWSMFDDFSLTFYGAGADAAKLYLDETLKNYAAYTPGEDVLYTEAYLTAYNDLVNAEHSAASIEEVTATLEAIDAAFNALQKNIELWKQLQAKMTDGLSMATDEKYEMLFATGDLVDYIDELEDAIDSPEMTNEELEETIAKINELMDLVREEFSQQAEPGTDMTDLLINPDFEFGLEQNKAEGWTRDVIDNNQNGNITPGPLGTGNDDKMIAAIGKTNHCFEAWHVWGFDVWQEVKNAPAGVYEISAQGYVRSEISGYTQGDEVDPTTIPIKLYMNESESNFPSVYSEVVAEEHYDETDNLPVIEDWSWNGTVPNYPNSMGAASLCFAWDMYNVHTFGLVQPGETMRIGVKSNANDNWWCIWDNFHITYQGFDPQYVKPALEAALEGIDLSQPMGKSVYEKAAALRAMADEAIASGDGRTMFNAIVDVNKMRNEILASVALFKQLNAAYESLQEVMGEYYNSAFINEASQLAVEVSEGIEGRTLENEDVQPLLDKIAAMKTKLRMPANYNEASDSNPINLTTVINNPNYDENLNGWSGTAAAYGAVPANAEIFNKDFDYYQDIVGLPAGTYQVSVQGFYRAGGSAADYETRDDASYSHAFLYALNGDSTVFSTALTRLAAEPTVAPSSEDTDLPSEYAWASKDNMLYVANSMTTAGDEFALGKYANNVVTFTVGADGKARIGIKKNVNIDQNWTIWDSWKLIYLGAASSQQPSGDASGIETIANGDRLTVEYFTLDGRKANAAQRGILIQKTTLSNGAVIVNKVRR